MGTNLLHQYQSTVAEGAGSGTPGGLVGPNEWNAGHQLYLDVNAQSGTSYTIAAADDGALLTFNNSSAVAVSLPQPQAGAAGIGSALGFFRGWFCFARNLGAGDATITPATSTINGAAKLVLKQYEQAVVVSDGSNYQALPIRLDITQTDGCYRGKIVASVAANALTLAVKTISGDDPSPADPVLFFMRDAGANLPGNIGVRIVTAALSITIPSCAALGHVSARDQQVFVYCVDNAGTIELAVSNKFFDPSVRLQSTTAIGAGSTDPATLYSNSARTNVAWKPLARCVSNQTTAGTWAAVPKQIDLAPFVLPTTYFHVDRNGSNQTGLTSGANNKVLFTNKVADPAAAFDNATNFRFQPGTAGRYQFYFAVQSNVGASDGPQAMVYKNGSVTLNGTYLGAGSVGIVNSLVAGSVDLNGTSDYVEFYVYVPSGITAISGSAVITYAGGFRIGS